MKMSWFTVLLFFSVKNSTWTEYIHEHSLLLLICVLSYIGMPFAHLNSFCILFKTYTGTCGWMKLKCSKLNLIVKYCFHYHMSIPKFPYHLLPQIHIEIPTTPFHYSISLFPQFYFTSCEWTFWLSVVYTLYILS